MPEPATTLMTAAVMKKTVSAVGAGGATVVTIASWEHLLHWWPVIIAVMVFLVSVGRFLRRIEDMERANAAQHKEISVNIAHGLTRVEDKFETFSEKLNHRDSLINGVERRITILESRSFHGGKN